jgi:hypothetical protein
MTTEPTEKKSIFAGSIKWVAATLVGAGAGAAKFVTDVRTEFNNNISSFPEITKYRSKTYEVEIERIKNARNANTITTSQFRKSLEDAKDALFEETARIGDHFAGVDKKANFFKDNTTETLKRFETLSEHTRMPVVFSAVASTVIGFAGTSMFLNSMANRHTMKEIAKKQSSENER